MKIQFYGSKIITEAHNSIINRPNICSGTAYALPAAPVRTPMVLFN